MILSADPTAVDPETLDRLQVLETIKEGATVFRLSDEGERSAGLTVRPDRRGETAFGRFIVAAAHTGDGEAAHAAVSWHRSQGHRGQPQSGTLRYVVPMVPGGWPMIEPDRCY